MFTRLASGCRPKRIGAVYVVDVARKRNKHLSSVPTVGGPALVQDATVRAATRMAAVATFAAVLAIVDIVMAVEERGTV